MLKKKLVKVLSQPIIITILVMLILASVSISMIVGENGVIVQAQKAKEEQKYAELSDRIQLWWNDLKISNYGGLEKVEDLEELVENLKSSELLTEEEANEILSNNGILELDLIKKQLNFNRVQVNVGDYVKFANQIWRVLYNDNYSGENAKGVQVVPEKPYGKDVILGDKSNIENAIKAYNSYYITLNEACEDLVPESIFVKSVRSIGSNPEIKKQKISPTDMHEEEKLDDWKEGGIYYEYNGKLLATFEETKDMDALDNLDNYLKPSEYIWYAKNSVIKNEKTTGLTFRIGTLMEEQANISATSQGMIHFEDSSVENHEINIAVTGLKVLPVVTLKAGSVNSIEKGSGTELDPYILDPSLFVEE